MFKKAAFGILALSALCVFSGCGTDISDKTYGTPTLSPDMIPPVPLEGQIASVQQHYSQDAVMYLIYVSLANGRESSFEVNTLDVPHQVCVIHTELPKVSVIPLKYIWPTMEALSKQSNDKIKAMEIDESNIWLKAFFGKDFSNLKNQSITIYNNNYIHYLKNKDEDGPIIRVLNKPQDKTMHYPVEVQYLIMKSALPSERLNDILSPVTSKPVDASLLPENFLAVQKLLGSLPMSDELKSGDWKLQSYRVDYASQTLTMIFKARVLSLCDRDVCLQFTFGKQATLVQVYGLGLQHLVK